MKNIRSAHGLAKHRLAIAASIGSYEAHTLDDLRREYSALLADLDSSPRFGLIAGRGVRAHCLGQLRAIGDELSRRAGLPAESLAA